MVTIVSIDDVQMNEIRSEIPGGAYRQTNMIDSAIKNTPLVFKVQYEPNRISSPHYHAEDQFQVVVAGKGTLGRHAVRPYSIHFARAFTPYGPLIADTAPGGLTFLTLRVRPTKGAFRLPESIPKLKEMPDRHPWQSTYVEDACSSDARQAASEERLSIERIEAFDDGRGLAVHSMTVPPNAAAFAPDPSGGEGQYIVVVEGSLLDHGHEKKAITVVSVAATNGPWRIQAGAQGLKAFVLDFPLLADKAALGDKVHAPVAKAWQCTLCSFVYDEAAGMPEEGIAAGTQWQDVPKTWKCPDCDATKAEFEVVEI